MNGQWLSVTLKSSCVPSHVCVFVCQPRVVDYIVSVSSFRISFPFVSNIHGLYYPPSLPFFKILLWVFIIMSRGITAAKH